MKQIVYTPQFEPFLWPSIKTACEAGEKGAAEDRNGNYEEAVKLYKVTEENLLYAIQNHATYDCIKNGIESKRKQFQKRIKDIESYLNEQRRMKLTQFVTENTDKK